MPNTRELWLAGRRRGIGGSDAAAILGLSPWRTEMDVWLDKTGRTDVEPEIIDPDRKFLLELGQEMEKGIARLYTLKTGRELEPIPEHALLIHPKFPTLIGTPDRLVLGESRGVEIKTENSFQHKFGEPGEPDAIPVAPIPASPRIPRWSVSALYGYDFTRESRMGRRRELLARPFRHERRSCRIDSFRRNRSQILVPDARLLSR
jgi:putative phage-type endonuclease